MRVLLTVSGKHERQMFIMKKGSQQTRKVPIITPKVNLFLTRYPSYPLGKPGFLVADIVPVVIVVANSVASLFR